MGNLCGKSSQEHDVPNKHDDGRLNPLNPHRPTADVPTRLEGETVNGSGPNAAQTGTANAGAAGAGITPGARAGTAANAGPVGRNNELNEWYNVLVRKLWPFISPAVTKMANEMLPPMLDQSKPTWMTRLELTKFDLGDDPIVLTKMDVNDGPDPGNDDVYLDFHAKWHAPQLDVELTVNPLPKFLAGVPGIKQATSLTVGVEDFWMEGDIRVTMVPLIKEIPVVGALQISLLSLPKYDMDLTLGAFEALESVIKPWLKSFVEDYVLETYLLPGHYFLPMATGIPDVQTPAGILEFTVVEAVNVPKMDYFTQSSPYCKLWLTGAKKHAVKTPYVDYTKNPKWDPARSTFGFAVHAPDHQKMVVALYDYDGMSADDEIGRVQIPLDKLGDEQPQDFWVSFETPEQKAERKKHEQMLAEGKSEHDVKHRDQDGNKKGFLQRTEDAVLKTIIPAAGGHDKELPNCRVRIKAIYHSLDVPDVARLNKAQNDGRRPDVTMIHEATTRRAVERFGLMDQILGAKQDPQEGGKGGDAGRGDKERQGEGSAQSQAQGGGNAGGGGAAGAQVLGGQQVGQPVGATGGPGRSVVGVGGHHEVHYGQPAQNGQPAQSAQPAQRVQPAQPAQNVQRVQPVQRVQQVQTVQPVQQGQGPQGLRQLE